MKYKSKHRFNRAQNRNTAVRYCNNFRKFFTTERLFGKDWKENWVVLFEDSTMAWYKHKEKLEMPNGTIIVKEAPEMLAVGEYTFRIPGTPQIPPGSNYRNLMAFGSRMKNEVHWLLATSENEVKYGLMHFFTLLSFY